MKPMRSSRPQHPGEPRRRAVRSRPVAVAAAVVAGVLAAAPATAQAGGQPTGQQKGAHGSSGALHGQRGALLTDEPLESTAALPSAADNRKVTYLSEGAGGRPVVVSGTVSLPKSPPPPGGWPVISWAHGTTGTSDACAPSGDTEDGPVHDYLGPVQENLDKWVAKGYAVVQTDYEGLGTAGEHPYLNGRSAANSVVDIVRAARDTDRRVGRDWIAMGHSQGGHAALAAATREDPAPGRGRDDVRLLGAVAIAPGGVDVSRTAEFIRKGGPEAQTAVAFLPPLLIGAAAADPDVDPDALLTDRAQPLLDAARTGCTADVREAAEKIPPEDVLEPDADLGPLKRYLKSQEPMGWRLRVPALVAQGTEDAEVSKPTTDLLVDDLCERSPDIGYNLYPGADHRASIPASLDDAQEFVRELRDGGTPDSSC